MTSTDNQSAVVYIIVFFILGFQIQMKLHHHVLCATVKFIKVLQFPLRQHGTAHKLWQGNNKNSVTESSRLVEFVHQCANCICWVTVLTPRVFSWGMLQ